MPGTTAMQALAQGVRAEFVPPCAETRFLPASGMTDSDRRA
jgi:hypothetical protein